MTRGSFAVMGVIVLLALPVAAAAQASAPSVSGTLVLTRLDRQIVPLSGAPSSENFSGVALGLEGNVPVWMFEMGIRYLNGSLGSNDVDVNLDVTEAELQLGLRPLPWVVVKAGPHARAFRTAQSTERWLFWEVRARAEAGLLSPGLGTYLELWGALVGNVNFGRSFGSGRGAEAGLTYHLAARPIWGRIAYRVDRGSIGGGSIYDSVQQVLIGVGYGRR